MKHALSQLVTLVAVCFVVSPTQATEKNQAPRPPQAPTMSCPIHGNACLCSCQEGGMCTCEKQSNCEKQPKLIYAPPGSYFRLPSGQLVTSYDPTCYQPTTSSSSATYQSGGVRYAPALPYQPAYYPNVGFRGTTSRGCSGGG